MFAVGWCLEVFVGLLFVGGVSTNLGVFFIASMVCVCLYCFELMWL